jgi:DNA mismatch endonuclease (patch repair protein)
MTSDRPRPSSPAVSAQLSRVRRRDTAPEVRLRSLLHRLGLRFRVDHPISGVARRRVDIVFAGARVAVFVDGCFWHGCPEHYVQPKANAAWWREKIAANRRRDAETNAALERLGWKVIRVWEHEPPAAAAARIHAAVTGSPNPQSASRAGTPR